MGNISFDNADFLKLYNSPLPSPLKSISVSKAKLKQDGFVKDCIVTLSENLEAAKRIGDPTLVQTCAAALNMFSVAAIYFLLQEFPSYKDPYKKMAPAMKYNAGK